MRASVRASLERRAPIRAAIRPAAIIVSFTGLSACTPSSLPPSISHPLAGSSAPEFHEVAAMSSREVGVPSLGHTRVTVVDFWASWCPSCQMSMPALDSLYRDMREDGVLVVGVSVDQTADDAVAMANALGTKFPIVIDSWQRIAGLYGVAQIPLTFVVDRAGVIRWVGRDPSDARRAVRYLLAEGQ